MTFFDNLKRMMANYQIGSFSDALNFWETPQQPSERKLDYESDMYDIEISENGTILDVVPMEINGLSIEQYISQVEQLLNKGASVEEAVLLGTLA